jgi:hypothetical protein
MWAVTLPREDAKASWVLLGHWPMLISTFGQDASGEVYVGDFAGAVYRIMGEEKIK